MGTLCSRTHSSTLALIMFPIAVLGSFLLVACEGSTVDPPTNEPIEEPSSVELIGASERTLHSLGQADAVEATVSHQKVLVTLSVIAEDRWNDDRRVLLIDEQTQIVTAHGAGTAVLAVGLKGGNSTPDTLTIHVRPEEPYVLYVDAPLVVNESTPAVLRGWKLDALSPGDIEAGAPALAVETIDSTRLAVYWTAVETDACEAIASTESLVVTGATKLWGQVEISLPKAGALQLEKGMLHRLKQEDVGCLLLAHGEYALAFFDSQFSYPDRFIWSDTRLSFEVKVDPPSQLPSMAPPAVSHDVDMHGVEGARHHRDLRDLPRLEVVPGESAVASSNDWWSYDPYEVGDTLEWFQPMAEAEGGAIVTALTTYRAILEPLTGERIPRDLFETMIGEIEMLDAIIMDRWAALFGRTPLTHKGQHMTMIVPAHQTWNGYGRSFGGQDWNLISVFADNFQLDWHRYVLLHEMVHSFHMTYLMYLEFDDGIDMMSFDFFTVEGLADFLASGMVAEIEGITWNANRPRDDFPNYMQGLWHPYWMVERGYQQAASWFLSMTDELAAGTPFTWEEAFDSVAVALRINRRGCEPNTCSSHEGLFDRMERWLGPEWDVTSSALRHALAVVLDGRTDNPLLQNPHHQHDMVAGHYFFIPERYGPLTHGSIATMVLRAEGIEAFTVTADIPLEWAIVAF